MEVNPMDRSLRPGQEAAPIIGPQRSADPRAERYGPMSDQRKALFKRASRGVPRYLFRIWAIRLGQDKPEPTPSLRDYQYETPKLILPRAFRRHPEELIKQGLANFDPRGEPMYNGGVSEELLITYDEAPRNFEDLEDAEVTKTIKPHVKGQPLNRGTLFSSWTASFPTLSEFKFGAKQNYISMVDTSSLNRSSDRVFSLDRRLGAVLDTIWLPEEFLIYGPVHPTWTIAIDNIKTFFEDMPEFENRRNGRPADPGFHDWGIRAALKFSSAFPKKYAFVVAVGFIGAVALVDARNREDRQALELHADKLRQLWQHSEQIDAAEFMNESTISQRPAEQRRTSNVYQILQNYYGKEKS
ncbi:hypothetical protein AMS68_006622 [Peltaster fructicola]|uniref:Uncharacterized protein n=1 Tax=Peltaster fructicola TaxID=286661 RepID=A0A6H0Y2F9_9PEZI|nr:hypothetical protein AMS68_006622 [Peltaster fructicola]